MTVTSAEIRAAINIPETRELSEDAIESAITRAGKYITVLKKRYSAPEDFFPPAEEARAIYLAYQTYADRVLQVQAGQYVEGKFDPITDEFIRDTRSKLDDLRKVADDFISIIKSFPVRPIGTFMSHAASAPTWSIGKYNYGEQPDALNRYY